MAHGPDTEELLRRIENMQDGILNVSGLRITSLPELPSEIQELRCQYTSLTSLPGLPSGLQVLSCGNTAITSLPELPSGLHTLYCSVTPLTILPDLPSSLQRLYCSDTLLILQMGDNETISSYNNRWRVWREEEASKKRCQERTSAIKGDLIAEIWRPDRFQKLLDAGGWDLVEAV